MIYIYNCEMVTLKSNPTTCRYLFLPDFSFIITFPFEEIKSVLPLTAKFKKNNCRHGGLCLIGVYLRTQGIMQGIMYSLSLRPMDQHQRQLVVRVYSQWLIQRFFGHTIACKRSGQKNWGFMRYYTVAPH